MWVGGGEGVCLGVRAMVRVRVWVGGEWKVRVVVWYGRYTIPYY